MPVTTTTLTTATTATKVHAPHAPLTDYYGQELHRRAWVRGIFERTAPDYERVESFLALGSGSWYRRHALQMAGLKPGMQVIDVGTGTGLVAREAAQLVGTAGQVLAVDPCEAMIAQAREAPGIRWATGSAESIPAPDASADFLCMGYALRHISDLSVAFAEFRRVLRPGGQLCLLEITCPESGWQRALLKAYMRAWVPLVTRLLARTPDMPLLMRYYWDTIAACAPPAAIMQTLELTGFVEVSRRVELAVFSEYCARRPA
jgi:demethylmenaquinone methyltransferase/2-methoxy-6-polyprenyl-1,4-benzoquinol methylase